MFVQQNTKACKMKEIKGKLALTFNQIRSIEEAFETLQQIHTNL